MGIQLNNKNWIALPVVAAMLAACGGGAPSAETSNATVTPSAVVENYADLVYANYQDALGTAQAMQSAIQVFVDAPSDATLAAAQEAWKQARVPYGQTEVFRFYNGPIDNEADGPEGLLNAWPMDEAYVDYVEGAADAGIVNDAATFPEITKALLEELNEKEGEENISSGYHAIEFLLWGQDLSAETAGQRSYTDYTTAANADRRKQYLTAVTALLIDHLQGLVDAWTPSQADNYRAAFLAEKPEESLRRMLIGMGSLSGAELAGERMTVAYETKEQEDEHSCFADNTHVDVIENIRGIHNVYLGRYTASTGKTVAGPGIMDLIAQQDKELAQELSYQLVDSLKKAEAIPVPFDQSILGADDAPGRVAVKSTIDALREQVGSVVAIAELLKIELNLEG